MKTKVLKQPSETLEGQIAEAGITGGQAGTEYQKMLAESCNLLVPTDDFGRVPFVAAMLRQNGYRLSPAPVCEECGQRLRVNRGQAGKVAAHFQHVGGKKCPGGMSPWHVAMQKAAVTLGFTEEYRCVNGVASGRKLDAFHQRKGLCLEFVNSMSKEYQRKHLELTSVVASGGEVRSVAWIFNSGARFATWAHSETVDAKKLYEGRISVGNLFRQDRGVRELVHAIGEQSCFTIYRGLMFGCIGCDLWECLPFDHPLQWMCQHERGFNFYLFRQGVGEAGKRVQMRYELNDTGRVDVEDVRRKLLMELETGKLQKASALRYRPTDLSVAGDACSSVSEKMPSDSDPKKCDGILSPLVRSNLTASEVKAQLSRAAMDRVEDDLPDWVNDRKCGQDPEPWEPASREPVRKDVTPNRNPSAAITITFEKSRQRREIRSSRAVFRVASNVNARPLSVHAVNKVLQQESCGRRIESSCGCGERRKIVSRTSGWAYWTECVVCGWRSGASISRRFNKNTSP